MVFLNIGVLAFVAFVTWWLTGIDKSVTGESKREHYFTRTLRCGLMMLLAAALVWMIETPSAGILGTPVLMTTSVGIALLLRSSVSELISHGFLGFLDPTMHDTRPLDPGKSQRYQDAIARMIQNGQRDEAVKLCEELKQSGEVDLVMLQNTLEFLGVPQHTKREDPLARAAQLRAAGKFAEAEQRLKSLLKKKPADVGAAMMLTRLYAQDLRQPDRAKAVLHALEKQPNVPASHLEFAHRSIDEWSRTGREKVEDDTQPKPESIDDLLAHGFFGSAVEKLEEQIAAQPQDFELRLKLAEVYAVNCKNFPRAEKIVRQMELAANFSPQQIETARAKLAAWHAAANHLPGAA